MSDRSSFRSLSFAALVLSILASCGGSDALEAGSLYSVSMGENGYQVAKVLVVDDENVHVRVYKNRFSERPSEVRVEELSLGGLGDAGGFGMGHLPLSRAAFVECKPEFMQNGSVAKDELEGYELWKSSGGSAYGKR